MRSIYLFVAGFAISLLLGAGIATAADGGKRLALIIGNSNYENISPLRNPRNDAELMAKTLAELGFEVTVEFDANRQKMARSILAFGRGLSRAGDDAVGLFFYAGHGVQARGTNYLLPLAATVDTEADLEIEAIDTNWVMSQFDEAGNSLNMVILDACRNNPFEGSFRSSSRGLARLNAPAGSLIAYSAAPGQVAVDGEGGNSPYTAALARTLRVPGVELLQVFRQVRLAVEQETGGRQTPWEEQSLRSDFFFRGEALETTAVETGGEAEPEQSSVASATGGNPALELAFWQTVKDSNDPVMFRAYLDQYPRGTFAALARVMIARLEVDAAQETGPEPTEDIEPVAAEVPEEVAGLQPADEVEAGGEDVGGGETALETVPEQDLPDTDLEQNETVLETLKQELTRRIQAALASKGCDPGPVDGLWGRQTERALERFADEAGVGLPRRARSLRTLRLIRRQSGRVCRVQCGPRRELRNGRCVVKTCSSGQYLTATGRCRTRTQQAAPSTPQPSVTTRRCGGTKCCCQIGARQRCVGAGSCIHIHGGHCVVGGCGG